MESYKQQFEKSIDKISNICALVSHKGKDYLFQITVKKIDDEMMAHFTLTDGKRFFWITEFNAETFREKQNALNISGSVGVFLDLIKSSITTENVSLIFGENRAVSLQINMHLDKKINVTLKTIFDLGQPIVSTLELGENEDITQ